MVLAAMAAGALIVMVIQWRSETPVETVAGDNTQTLFETDSTDERTHLYFSDREQRHLISEQRQLGPSDNPVVFAENIVKALIKGPRDALVGTIPPGTRLRALFIDDRQTAYVDLSGAVTEDHPGGAQTELLTIYSIVNSLILNVDEIETVRLLIGGRETVTLAGHIDIQTPFSANMLLIR